MIIEPAVPEEKEKIKSYDRHIPPERLGECISNHFIYVLKDEGEIVGVLRYSLFWQTIPFLDLLYIDEAYRGKGYGRQMLEYWENAVRLLGYGYVMTSTQEDETAQFFYEALGYQKTGSFLPPEQEANELMYLKQL